MIKAGRAALVGAVQVPVAWGVSVLVSLVVGALGGHSIGGFILGILFGVALGLVSVALIGWALLWLVRVRPAAPVALLAPVLVYAELWLLHRADITVRVPSVIAALVGATGYGLAAAIVAAIPRRRP